MIREDLLEFQYYLDRLSKFMQESYGINEQVRTFHSLLKQVNDYYDEFFKQFDFFKNNPEGEMLDKIGSIFGCRRNFTIPIYDDVDIFKIIDYEEVNLNDKDFLTFIKTQVIKQNFDGRRETLQKLYSTFIDKTYNEGLIDLLFLYTTEDEPTGAVCTIRWNIENPSYNMRLLFENGYLTIESVGILYRRQITNFTDLAYYASEGDTPTTLNCYQQSKGTLLTEEPSDWENGGFLYLQGIPSSSDWITSKIYAKLINGEYIIIPNKPTNWNDIYNTCVILEKTNGSETFATDTYYRESSVGGLYA